MFSSFLPFKDAGLASMVRLALEPKLRPYGTMTQLQLDSATKTIRLTLDLKGEPAPIELILRDYAIQETDGRFYVTVREVVSSREWITALASQFAVDRPIEIPAAAAKAARMLGI